MLMDCILESEPHVQPGRPETGEKWGNIVSWNVHRHGRCKGEMFGEKVTSQEKYNHNVSLCRAACLLAGLLSTVNLDKGSNPI